MKKALFSLLFITALTLISCKKENLSHFQDGIKITVSSYPSFSDTKTLGTPDAGKESWANGDILYLVFQTADDSLSKQYRITRTESGWSSVEVYENGEYQSATSITVSEPSKALAFYAPCYEFVQNRILALKDGRIEGTDEFFKWSSGEEYDISGDASLNIAFVKDYSRLRVVADANSTVYLESSNFIPVGHNTKKLGKGTIAANADANGNAFFYGKWNDGTNFKVISYKKDSTLLFSEEFTNKPACEAGTSYALNCKNTEGYTFISEISALATSSEKTVTKKIHNAVVTYAIGSYAHLEDESGAILIYNSSHGLKVGQKITGTITGKLTLYKTSPQFTSFNCSSATVTTTENIPCTTVTLADLLDNFDKYIHCRILLKNITITKGISTGNTSKRSGTISQDASSIDIYGVYSASPAVLTTGLTGDLIAYPAYYNSTKRLSIYVASQFTEGGSGEEEIETPLTALSAIGCYNSINTETPVATLLYQEGSDQISCSKGTGERGFRLFNIKTGSYLMIDIPSSSLTVGNTYQATVNTNGNSVNHNVMVTKKTSSNVWLEDYTENEGYIITIK